MQAERLRQMLGGWFIAGVVPRLVCSCFVAGTNPNEKRLQPRRAAGVLHGGFRDAGGSLGTVGFQMSVAKGVATALALVVIEHVVVDGATNHCAGGTAGSTTEQGPHEGASDAAYD
jgi:hypothetical protein